MVDKLIVGSEEWCSFSTLNIPAIKARVDSGAKKYVQACLSKRRNSMYWCNHFR